MIDYSPRHVLNNFPRGLSIVVCLILPTLSHFIGTSNLSLYISNLLILFPFFGLFHLISNKKIWIYCSSSSGGAWWKCEMEIDAVNLPPQGLFEVFIPLMRTGVSCNSSSQYGCESGEIM